MPSFALLRLTDKLACQGSVTVYGALHPEDLQSATDVLAIEDAESMAFRYSRVSALGEVRPITAQLRAGRVVTIVWTDGAIDEWRVGPVTDGRGLGGMIDVQCIPIWRDCVERADSAAGKGWVSEVVAGERIFDYEISERTATSILSSFVIPNLPSYVTLGTVDSSIVIPTISVNHLTPWALAVAVRDSLRAMDVTCELRLRRNGTTDYKLDLVAQVGASAATPVFHPHNALLTLNRKTDPTLQATRVLVNGGTAPDTLPGVLGRARWRGGAPAGLVIALTDRNGGSHPIGFDNQWVGAYLLRVKTGRTFLIDDADATAGTVTLNSTVSTIAADEDFEFRLTEPLTNTRLVRPTSSTRWAVSAVPDGTHITCAVSAPITVDNQFVDWYARVWNATDGGTLITTTRVTGSVAATDVIAVLASAGVTNAHYVEFVQLDGAGEVPAYVDHPTYSAADPTGYGVKVMELSRPGTLGIQQLVPNSWMRTWTNSANPPDGWTRAGAATFSRDTTTPRYAGYAQKIVGAGIGATVTTAVFSPNWDSGHPYLSVRAWVYFETYIDWNTGGSFNVGITSTLTVYAATAAGAAGASLGVVTIMPTDAVATYTKVGAGGWVELKVEGITLAATTAPYGVVATFDATGGVNLAYPQTHVIAYLDTIEAYPFSTCPSPSYEFGDAQGLTQAGNGKLGDVATPPVFYEFSVRDLERAFPTEYSRLALTLGGSVRAADVEYGIDTTVRLLKLERDLLNPTNTRLTLGNRPLRFTSIVRTGARVSRGPVSALISSAGSAAVLTAPATNTSVTTFSGAVTLPAGTTVETTSSPPVITVDPGATVVIRPPVTTLPETGVAVDGIGAPRRPRSSPVEP